VSSKAAYAVGRASFSGRRCVREAVSS